MKRSVLAGGQSRFIFWKAKQYNSSRGRLVRGCCQSGGGGMLKEIVVVEGQNDRSVVQRAVEADIIITGGARIRRDVWQQLQTAYERRGLILLLDPDQAGDAIRRRLAAKFPLAKHAFVPRRAATANNDVGIEQASPEAVASALAAARSESITPVERFSLSDLYVNELVGAIGAEERRARLGELLGIGYANARQFVNRLNRYGIQMEEFARALAALKEG